MRMSDLSDLIDKLDDGGVLHSAGSTAVCGSGAVVFFPLLSRQVGFRLQVCFFIFIDCFFCLLLFLLIRLPHFW